jgi:hypothetical protein
VNALRLQPTSLALSVGAAAACLLTALALVWGGPVVALAPVALLAAFAALSRPAALLCGFLVVAMALETDDKGFLPGRAAFFAGVPSLADFAFALVALAVAADLVRRRRAPVLPGAFTFPLVLLAIAAAAGLANGYLSGASPEEAVPPLQALIPLITLPFLVVNVGWEEARDRAIIAAAAALAVVKGLEGMLSWALGAGRPVGDSTLTFYSPAPNFLLLLLLLGALAAALSRARIPLWVLAGIPVCAAAFLLSYRRNFWIAGVLGVAVVLLLGSRLRAGRVVLVTVAVFAIAVRTILGVTGAPELEGTVGERLQSLSPERVRVDPYDRYRLDEARNVLAEVRGHPVFGLGLGVPWTASEPLPAELEGGRQYTHVVFLWYWLKLGALGAIAYVALMLTAIFSAVRVARFHHDVYVRTTGLAVAAGVVALMAAETTGSFTGVGSRSSVLFGALVGWLALVSRRARRPA